MANPVSGDVFLLFLGSFMRGSELDEPARHGRQDFGGCGVHGHVVFDTDAAFSLDIDARLKSDHASHANLLHLSTPKSRRFMDFDAQAMAGTVDEITTQTSPSEYLTSRPVDVSSGHARL